MNRPMYVIGDVHGDANRLLNILVKHKLIKISNNVVSWAQDNVILLLMGDVLDAKSRVNEFDNMVFQNSLSDMWILEFLDVISKEAGKCNSAVLMLFGNHELMNILGDHAWVSPYHILNPSTRREYFNINGRGFEILCRLAHTSITYNGNLYSHAGIPLSVTPNQSRFFNKKITPTLLSKINSSDLHEMISHRDYHLGKQDAHLTVNRVNILCSQHKIKRMVIGHNFTAGRGIISSHDAKIVHTDVGISRAFGLENSDESRSQILLDPGDGNLVVLHIDGSVSSVQSHAE